MAAEASFDVVSDFDRQELVNAIDQARREVQTRYDLKNAGADIALDKDQITLTADDEFHIKAVYDVLQTKAVRRGLDLKIFDPGKIEPAGGGKARQVIKLRRGISTELGREIVKLVKAEFPKTKQQIQGDAVRITGKSRDELQAVIRLLKGKEFPVPLQYTNYR
jgi:uncharacterized protein YajQ (UPF0234 family)